MKTLLISSIAVLWLVFAQVAVPAQRTVEVLRPNSTDRLQPGVAFRIQWRAQGFTNNLDWSVILYTNNVRLRFVSATPVDDGEGNWHADLTVPSDLPSRCDYTLNVSEDMSDVEDHSDVFCLGAPVVSLRISQVEICWISRPDRMYQVQYRSTLTTNLWTDLGASLQGNGSTNCITDAVVPGQPQKYYRVVELP